MEALRRKATSFHLLTFCLPLAVVLAFSEPGLAVQQQQTGTISGRVTDQAGTAISGAQVVIEGTTRGGITDARGAYTIRNVPAGTHTLQAQMLGYRTQTATVTVPADGTASQDFTLAVDPLGLDELVVTGTFTPREKLNSSVSVSTFTPEQLELANPRSTTELLRYVPGFTRVESSGGEVNQNYVMRGILGVEYVMFLEDGLPVFPTMHTFWMNGDNLFRMDENIERVEVVRGGSSALFGSNTPGAIMNIMNKTGGPEVGGTLKVTAGTGADGLALGRYDVNVNGPLAEEWHFNVGGFYRYDQGVRPPGFPGVRGGQMKASITRQLDIGYVRASVKLIDDRNQFILPLPFRNPDDPEYVAGFSDFGAYSSPEANHTKVRTPAGELELPLDNGLRTQAYWLTADAAITLGDVWNVRNTAQIMSNEQQFNAIFPGTPTPAADFVAEQVGLLQEAGFNVPDNPEFELVYTNQRDTDGNRIPFSALTENGFLSASQQPHIEKPLSAFQNQLVVSRAIGQHTVSAGVYFAHYTQTNRWRIPLLLMDVRDQSRLVDLTIFDATGAPIAITSNGYRNFMGTYEDGFGHTTIISGMLGGEIQLTERLRADLGFRYEFSDYVQSAENSAAVDLDGDPATRFNNMSWGDGSFRHVASTMDDVAGSLGLNYTVTDEISVYALGSRGYKMPALDEFLTAQTQEQVDLFDAREVLAAEGGVRYASERYGLALTGFFTQLKNIVGQGLVTDPETGGSIWIVTTSPENRSYGAEVEASGRLPNGLGAIATATVLKAELGSGAGADIGSWLNNVPRVITNLAVTYQPPGTGWSFLGDWHFVDERFAAGEATSSVTLPAYSYFNYGAKYKIPDSRITLSADLLNAFQSKGLEEGDPRTALTGTGGGVFNARPVLPRRLTVSARYDF